MKLNLRMKILLSVICIVFVVLGTSTLINVRDLRQDYIEAIEWRSKALAQRIISDVEILQKYKSYYLTHPEELLEALSKQCAQLYDIYKEEDISHFAVLNTDGWIAAHNNEALLKTSVEDALLPALESSVLATVLAGPIYHTLVPIPGTQGTPIGMIDIGVPKKLVEEKIELLLIRASLLFGVFLLLTFFSISLLTHMLLTKPVKQLAAMGQQLAEGRLVQSVDTVAKRGDEIAVLHAVFNGISRYVREIAAIASRIATGELGSDVRLRSEHDVLGKAVRDMLRYLRSAAKVALQIEEGNLRETIQVRSKNDAFGQALWLMMKGLRSLIAQIRTSAEEIVSTKTEVSSCAARNIDIVQNVSASAEKTMSTMKKMDANIEEVAHRMDILSSSVEKSFASVKQVTSVITHIASNAEKLTGQSHQTKIALNGAVNSLETVVESTDVSQQLSQETLQDALAGQQAVEQIMSSMETLQETMTTAVEAIGRFVRRSQDIDTILDVIRDIADRTSLLALNASIIAAQAGGGGGHGFGIVADEIKSLAHGVMVSTKDIAAIVDSLQRDTDSVVQTVHRGAANVQQSRDKTHQAQQTLQKIAASAQRSSSLVTEITGALHQVMKTSRELSMVMQEVDVMTDEITTATNEQQVSMKQIHTEVEHINDMASEIRETTELQSSGVHDVVEATRNVTTLIEQNLESSDQLTVIAQRFASQAEILLQSVDRFALK